MKLHVYWITLYVAGHSRVCQSASILVLTLETDFLPTFTYVLIYHMTVIKKKYKNEFLGPIHVYLDFSPFKNWPEMICMAVASHQCVGQSAQS